MRKKKVLIVILLMIVGFAVLGGWYVYHLAFAPNTAFEDDEFHVYVKTGSSFEEVIEQVSPLIHEIHSFRIIAEKKGYDNNIKPGHFILKKGMSNNDIVSALRGRNIPVRIRFNNQERLEDLAGHIAKQLEADSISLIETMRNQEFLKNNGLSQENALSLYIPNTYEFYWNTSAKGFRDRMKKENDRFWTEERLKKAAHLNLTKEEVVTLASIVQKETAMVDERNRVAGVYLNRLRKGMLLQADPTVIYAIKKHDNNFNQIIKRVLYKDLEINSPYNTYMYAGLPPGPITMPDISSIDAVLNAENHEYLFFVADVDRFGYHKFSKTLAQHNVYKAAYVRWLNSQNLRR
ncbi:MAG TPA: endolytic transglycosylase MltG [Flavobacteriaceae bacterium]|nr:endolytic transglycosylase MltG [Flavobacteriaceae bacterium]